MKIERNFYTLPPQKHDVFTLLKKSVFNLLNNITT